MNEQFANEPYKVSAEVPHFITVCASCFPGDSILSLFPDLKGCNISHSICPGHATLFRRELAKFAKK